MPSSELAPGQVLTAAHINTYYMRQVIATGLSSARPTGYEGRAVYDTDTDALNIYASATTGWKPPWNLPWGRMGHATNTSGGVVVTVAGGDVTIPGLSITATLVTNRLYRASFHLPVLKRTASGLFSAEIFDASTKYGGASMNLAAGEYGVLTGSALLTGNGAKTLTVKGGTASDDWVLNVSALFPAYFILEDVGSTGAPA